MIIQAGDVVKADVLTDRDGRSKGYHNRYIPLRNLTNQSRCGVAEFSSVEDAQKAIRDLNNTSLLGRVVYLREVTTCI